MVKGLQGDDDKYVQVHADCKHFSTFDGPGNGGRCDSQCLIGQYH